MSFLTVIILPYAAIFNHLSINKSYTSIPIYSNLKHERYPVTCKVSTGYHGISDIEHGLSACTVVNPLAKARGLLIRTGGQTVLYVSHTA